VGKYLRTFTLLDRGRIDELEAEHAAHPEARPAQRALAFDVTTRVHGEEEARLAIRVSEAAFSREPLRDPALLDQLYASLDHFDFGPEELDGGALRLAVAGGLYASNGEARRAISQGGLSINDVRVKAPEDAVPAPIDGRFLVLRAGKKSLTIGRRRI
jgi:tyrosyl-tRNA synthetase